MKKRERKIIIRVLPKVGSQLIGKFKGVMYYAEIVEDKKRKGIMLIEYKGHQYSSMTAAAEAITNQPTNGWRFWKVQIVNKHK